MRKFLIFLFSFFVGFLAISDDVGAVSYNGSANFTGWPAFQSSSSYTGTAFSYPNAGGANGYPYYFSGTTQEQILYGNITFRIQSTDPDGYIGAFYNAGGGCGGEGKINFKKQGRNVVYEITRCTNGDLSLIETGNIINWTSEVNSLGLDPTSYIVSINAISNFGTGSNKVYIIGLERFLYSDSQGKLSYRSLSLINNPIIIADPYVLNSAVFSRKGASNDFDFIQYGGFFSLQERDLFQDFLIGYNSGKMINNIYNFTSSFGYTGSLFVDPGSGSGGTGSLGGLPIYSDYLSDCGSFLDVGCYIKGTVSYIIDFLRYYLIPNINFDGYSRSCSGETLSNSGNTGFSYLRNLDELFGVMIPTPPLESSKVCTIFGGEFFVYYQTMIGENFFTHYNVVGLPNILYGDGRIPGTELTILDAIVFVAIILAFIL